LEDQCGLRRDVIGSLVHEIRTALGAPRSVASNARLVVNAAGPTFGAQYIDSPSNVSQGTVLPLQAIIQRIDAHLGVGQLIEPDGQWQLDLGPVQVATASRGACSSSSAGDIKGIDVVLGGKNAVR
jgi:hypothetical protein